MAARRYVQAAQAGALVLSLEPPAARAVQRGLLRPPVLPAGRWGVGSRAIVEFWSTPLDGQEVAIAVSM